MSTGCQLCFSSQEVRKIGYNIKVSTGDPNDGSYTFGFLVWSGLLRDFATAQSGILNPGYARAVLGSQFVTAATGSVVNMENDVRHHTTEVYLPAIVQEFDNDVSLSVDVYAELIVSTLFIL